jgi:hypothetical protein
MAASVSTRSSWTDDSGTGLTGTIINDAELQKIYDAIDLLLSGTGAYTTLSTGGKLRVEGAGIQVKGAAAPSVSAAGEAVVYVDSTTKELMVSENGSAFGRIARVLSRDVSGASVLNSAVETTLFSFAVPGGTLRTDRSLVYSLIGVLTNNSGSGQTVTVRVKYGATTILTWVFTNVNSSVNVGHLNLDVELCARNATNEQVAKGTLAIDGTGDATTLGTAVTKDFVGGGGGGQTLAGGIPVTVNKVGIAEDSTVSKNFVVTVQFGAASATLGATFYSSQLLVR